MENTVPFSIQEANQIIDVLQAAARSINSVPEDHPIQELLTEIERTPDFGKIPDVDGALMLTLRVGEGHRLLNLLRRIETSVHPAALESDTGFVGKVNASINALETTLWDGGLQFQFGQQSVGVRTLVLRRVAGAIIVAERELGVTPFSDEIPHICGEVSPESRIKMAHIAATMEADEK